MPKQKKILSVYSDSFRANIYSKKPFRMIGLIDADIEYDYGTERVTLAFFRSSGTNSGKTKGLWYPIVGIKIEDGSFTEFTEYINHVLKRTTRHGEAGRGWLAKSLFFKGNSENKKRGFSCGIHYKTLLWIGYKLRELYENGQYKNDYKLTPEKLNEFLYVKTIYADNKHPQRENFEKFIEDIYKEK